MIEMIPNLTLSEPFPDIKPLWTDPITGIQVPKDPLKNMQWRMELLKRAERDTGFQAELYTMCSQSLLLWINSMVWTYRLFKTDSDGIVRQCTSQEAHVPFVTWAIQDQHLTEIETAIDDGYDLLTDKSRDQGATWDHVVGFLKKIVVFCYCLVKKIAWILRARRVYPIPLIRVRCSVKLIISRCGYRTGCCLFILERPCI